MNDVWAADPRDAPRGIDDQTLREALPELQDRPPMVPLGTPSPLDAIMNHPGPIVMRRPQGQAIAQWQQTEVPTMHRPRRNESDPWPWVAVGLVGVCGLIAPISLTAMQRDPGMVAIEEFSQMAQTMGRPSYTCVSWSCPPAPEAQPMAQQPATTLPLAPAPIQSAPIQSVIFQDPNGRQRRGVVETIAGRDDVVMIRFVDAMEAY
ncbi:MAG: hypothetical protein HC771_13130 [Synechococcales cyanobacterium CRU_2_2]|nr:hypothetical protein [Synechococcales cyanobacterium CRU_2_2]